MPTNLNATSDLPPPRQTKPMKSVSPPLSSTRLHRLVYVLVILTTLLTAYYSYRIFQWKTQVGGWWNLALGRRPVSDHWEAGTGMGYAPPRKRERNRWDARRESVEDRINALAEALGMPSRDLASAIAGAVREYVPPASLSSVAAAETGPVVQALLRSGLDEAGDNKEGENGQQGASGAAAGVMEGVVSGVGSFVGMDEP